MELLLSVLPISQNPLTSRHLFVTYLLQLPLLCRALIRAGRFDTRINTMLPDVRARHKILQVHATKVKLHQGKHL